MSPNGDKTKGKKIPKKSDSPEVSLEEALKKIKKPKPKEKEPTLISALKKRKNHGIKPTKTVNCYFFRQKVFRYGGYPESAIQDD